MTRSLICTILACQFVGCGSEELRTPTAKIQLKAQGYVDGWAKATGGRLPAQDEQAFFADNFEHTKPVLVHALSDPRDKVRSRAAVMVERIGRDASPLLGDVLNVLRIEKKAHVRICFYGALRGIGERSEIVLEPLRAMHEKGRVAENLQDVEEEHVYASATLFALSIDPSERLSCEEFVCRWLVPPEPNLSAKMLDHYWDLRWCAVTAIRHMKGSTKPLPLLRAMLQEPSARDWVATNVADTLIALDAGPEKTN